ncbi:hypothetical protein JYU34_006239 [Plutella xylostella]|uniref:Major facilitator superfamily (MFS) profile domain-containing protein n=1 Tax=Plutella xylostella TaxID=51655 RepID=A0ABQ7QV81_PLUXY|nr:hypothetical protein JYU34_006239 [Plutella xylostella]
MEKVTSDITIHVPPPGLGARHGQAALLFLCMVLMFCMRANMSLAVVGMVAVQPQRDPPAADFRWDAQQQAVLLSSFFWGYVCTQIPAAQLSRAWGGKKLLLGAMAVNAAVCWLLPLAARAGGFALVCACRILQGLTQAGLYPAVHHLISQWVPPQEQGLLGSIIYSGSVLGIALQQLGGGWLAARWGWAAIFYADALLATLWALLYVRLGAAAPEQASLQPGELAYIQAACSRTGEQEVHPTPWLEIAGSRPFWALVAAHCGQNWGFFTLMTEVPTYMATVLKFDIKSNGIFSCLPYLAMYVLSLALGAAADAAVRRRWLSLTAQRKLSNTIGLWGSAGMLVALAYCSDARAAVAALTAAVALNAGIFTGFMLNHMDLAPNFSASLMGVSNFLANIVSVVAPLVCGKILHEQSDPVLAWRLVFVVAALVYVACNLVFLLLGTARRQRWDAPPDQDDLELSSIRKINSTER